MPEGLDVRSACLFMTADPQWRRKLFFAGLVLMLPAVGWPMLLGYRKLTIDRVHSGADPVLPEWGGNFGKCLTEGLKCCAVIAAYLLPASALTWSVIASTGHLRDLPWLPAACFLFAFPIFAPIALPTTLAYLAAVPAEPLPAWLAALLIAAYAASVFVIPLGFLRVSLTGRYLSAFNLSECAKFGARNARLFLLAWFHSSIVSLLGHFCIPFSAWGVAWAYLAIVYLFNEVLVRDKEGAELALSSMRASRPVV